MRHLQTILVIFASKSCIFADNFIIWPKNYEKMECSRNYIVPRPGVSACLAPTLKWVESHSTSASAMSSVSSILGSVRCRRIYSYSAYTCSTQRIMFGFCLCWFKGEGQNAVSRSYFRGGAFGTFLQPIFLKISVLEGNTKTQRYF